MTREIPIKKMTVTGTVVDVGAAAAKAMPPGVRHRYYVDVQYETEDGTVIPSIQRALTKPKLQAKIQSTHEEIARGCRFACRTHDDTGWYVIMRMTINLR